MKKTVLGILVLALALGANAYAADFDDFSDSVGVFAETIVPSLPSAAALGGTWSDAWIGNLLGIPPHFGVGASAGAILVPAKGFSAILDTMGTTIPSELAWLGDLGIPFPVVVVEGRIGGIILPFDLGLKFGTLPENTDQTAFSMEYLVVGGDVRFPIIKENLLLPGISIGVGANYLSGGVGYSFDDVNLASVPTGPSTTANLTLADPTVKFSWETLSYDAKVQISKSLLILTPYAGAGVSYSNSSAAAGFYSDLQLGGATVSQPTLDLLNANAGTTFTAEGLEKRVEQNGKLGFRLYGGASLNILLAKIDVQAIYNFGDLATPETGSFGGSLGLRLQL